MRRIAVAVAITNLTCVACAVILLLGCRWYFPTGGEAFVEESFVNFRYARHVAEGHGFVWNVGEQPVPGVTGFAWVWALVKAGRVAQPGGSAEVSGVPTEMFVAPILGAAHLTVAIFAAAYAALLMVRAK